MSDYGIGSYGFNLKPMPVIKAELVKAYQDKFGQNINTSDDSHIGQDIDIRAYNEYRIWQQMQMIYNSQTVNGAEGIFLDEIYAKQDIWRKGKQAGGGEIAIETDKTCPYTQTISKDIEYFASNGVKYKASSDVIVGASVIAYKLQSRDLEVKTYTFERINPVDGTKQVHQFNLAALHPTNIKAFLTNVSEWFQTVVNVPVELIELDELNLDLYVGYQNHTLVGMDQVIGLNVVPMIGNRVTQLTVVAQTKGYHPLPANQITSMTSTPVGFVRVTNVLPFSSGADVQSDASFRATANQLSEKGAYCTRPAMIAGMLEVKDVVKAKFRKVVTEDGDVQLTPIILGGDVKDIAHKLYAMQPIDNYFLGSVSYPVTTEDGDIETIRFDRGVVTDCDIKVVYKTKNTLALSTSEVNLAKSNLTDLSQQFQIGSKIFNASLKSAVFDSTDYGRFVELRVYIKRTSEGVEQYTEVDFQPLHTELPTLDSERISFIQEV